MIKTKFQKLLVPTCTRVGITNIIDINRWYSRYSQTQIIAAHLWEYSQPVC